jgi:hypothetical protein
MSQITLYPSGPSGPPTGLDLGEAGSVVTNYGPGSVSYSDVAEPFVSEGTIAADDTATLAGTQFFRSAVGAVIGARALTPSAEGGSGVTLVDLGVVDIMDLLDNGSQTLYTPSEPALVVQVAVDMATLVLPDTQGISVFRAMPPLNAATPFSQVSSSFGVRDGTGPPAPKLGSDPVVAALVTPGFAFDGAVGTWAADTAYGALEVVSAAGHMWASQAGTSDSTPPDFAGNIGGSVVDGTVTWQDQGALPTVGSARFYALIVTPS